MYIREPCFKLTFKSLLNAYFMLIEHLPGHLVCSGGITHYASLRLSETILQALGRWSSSAWKIYIHDHPAVRAAQQLVVQNKTST